MVAGFDGHRHHLSFSIHPQEVVVVVVIVNRNFLSLSRFYRTLVRMMRASIM